VKVIVGEDAFQERVTGFEPTAVAGVTLMEPELVFGNNKEVGTPDSRNVDWGWYERAWSDRLL